MKSFTRIGGRVFWLVCALCVLLPGIAAGAGGSASQASQAGLKTRLYASSQAGLKPRRYAESHRNLTATGHRHVDSADADSESGDRVTTCALLAGLHISQRAPRLEDFSSRIDSGTRASRRLALGPRFAPRPPPAPRQL
jgi:hypothetical protein